MTAAAPNPHTCRSRHRSPLWIAGRAYKACDCCWMTPAPRRLAVVTA